MTKNTFFCKIGGPSYFQRWIKRAKPLFLNVFWRLPADLTFVPIVTPPFNLEFCSVFQKRKRIFWKNAYPCVGMRLDLWFFGFSVRVIRWKWKAVEHISTNFAESGLQADSGEIGTNTFEQVFLTAFSKFYTPVIFFGPAGLPPFFKNHQNQLSGSFFPKILKCP